jgi:hypothetical protein
VDSTLGDIMGKQQRDLIVVIVLLVILAGLGVQRFQLFKETSNVLEPDKLSSGIFLADTHSNIGQSGPFPDVQRREVHYTGFEFRDPIRYPPGLILQISKFTQTAIEPPPTPLEEPAEVIVATEPPEIHVKAILWGVDPPQALIDSQVVTVGDWVGKSLVTAIDQEGVHIKFLGTSFIVGINKNGH